MVDDGPQLGWTRTARDCDATSDRSIDERRGRFVSCSIEIDADEFFAGLSNGRDDDAEITTIISKQENVWETWSWMHDSHRIYNKIEEIERP